MILTAKILTMFVTTCFILFCAIGTIDTDDSELACIGVMLFLAGIFSLITGAFIFWGWK